MIQFTEKIQKLNFLFILHQLYSLYRYNKAFWMQFLHAELYGRICCIVIHNRFSCKNAAIPACNNFENLLFTEFPLPPDTMLIVENLNQVNCGFTNIVFWDGGGGGHEKSE